MSMHFKRILSICIISIFSTLFIYSLSDEEDRLRRELKWGNHGDLNIRVKSKTSPLLPDSYNFTVSSSGKTIRKDNFELIIPAGAFRKSTIIRIIYLKTPADFASADIALNLRRGGNDILLESSGMFHLTFVNTRQKPIIARKVLTLKINAYSSEKVEFFNRQSASLGWQKNDKNSKTLQEIQRLSSDSRNQSEGTLFYGKLKSGGWYNFDIEKPEYTCISGVLKTKSKATEVRAVGLSYNGLSYGRVESSGRFFINVLKNSKVKIYAKDQRRLLMGAMADIISQDTTGFNTKPSSCQKTSAPLVMKKVKANSFKKRSAFLKAIGIS